MSNKITFKDLENKDNMVYFLQKVWEAGFMTAKMNPRLGYQDAKERFMPDFMKELNK